MPCTSLFRFTNVTSKIVSIISLRKQHIPNFLVLHKCCVALQILIYKLINLQSSSYHNFLQNI